MSFYRLVEEGGDMLRSAPLSQGKSLPLSDVSADPGKPWPAGGDRAPLRYRARGERIYWVQEFTLIYSLSHDIVVEEVKDEFEDAFARIWFGEAENDCFNRLLIGTRLSWREIALLRAYARYLRQVHFPYSVEYIAETMANHLHITAAIVELFLTRFSPVFDGDEEWRGQREMAVEERILDSLEEVQNLGEDRIIRQFVRVVKATLRTNFFQEGEDGALKSYFSFKLRPADIPDIPQPVPMYEIFVYSPRVEGVHLRGGKVARGGLRWSDRQEDFRTEVLGLVKAQQVKNAVIVPVGAKGGFVARQLRPEMSRDEVQEEGIACYEMFIRGLLDITDNRSESGMCAGRHRWSPRTTRTPTWWWRRTRARHHFPISPTRSPAQYGFWLGDAFASGGSVGYDHKKMGITAAGAWVSVQRHFREMGIDMQTPISLWWVSATWPATCSATACLLSRHVRLVAAFQSPAHFSGPRPGRARQLRRARQAVRSCPAPAGRDYNADLISEGGGLLPALGEIDRAFAADAGALRYRASAAYAGGIDLPPAARPGGSAVERRYRHLRQVHG